MGAEIKAELRDDVRKYLQEQARPPGLAIVRVAGDAASAMYSKAILRIAEGVGVRVRLEELPPQTSAHELRAVLHQLNVDETMQGMLVRVPLPAHVSKKLVAHTLT